MKITVYDEQDDLPIDPASARRIVKETLAYHQVKTDALIVHFVSNEKMCSLHKEFFDDPSPTDCITFPLDPPKILAEVVICPKIALEREEEPYQETRLYLIHTLLHSIGYRDKTAEEKKKMRFAENETIEYLEKKGIHLTP